MMATATPMRSLEIILSLLECALGNILDDTP
jgi:hypothetical protein